MNNELVQSDKEFESCQIKGESISLWIPLVLALIGIVSSIFITYSLLNSGFKTGALFSWPFSLITQNKPKTTNSTGNEIKNLAEGKQEHVKQDSKSFEVDVKNNIVPSIQDLINEKKMQSSAENNTSSITKYRVNLADSDRKASDIESALSPPPPSNIIEPSKKLTETRTIGNKGVKPPKLATVEQKPALLPNCPSRFFFSFPRDSAVPDKQGSSSKIQELMLWVKQHSDTKIFIEGHTDSFGPEEYNLLLSYRRAKAAEKILINAGISKKQLIIRAFGEQEPIQNRPRQSKYNRRVSVRIEAIQNCIKSLNNGDLN